MKSKLMGAFVLLALVVLAFGVVGQAAAAGSVDGVINDAQNGTIDKNWSAAQVRAALAYLQNNPLYSQYSDAQGVLEDYLASLQAPGAQGPSATAGGSQGAQLAFTGSNVLLILATGGALVGGGLVLRRRSHA
ncbi:MAG TPA: hypothetical protein VIK32_12140 [Candidatus Limnocylindrales bacterium]